MALDSGGGVAFHLHYDATGGLALDAGSGLELVVLSPGNFLAWVLQHLQHHTLVTVASGSCGNKVTQRIISLASTILLGRREG
jgi:hypothetical protein